MEIRKVTENEIDSVMEIIEEGRTLLKSTSKQWQNGYPNRDSLLDDIHNSFLYGAYINDKLVGVEALVHDIFNVDYDEIEGRWVIPYTAKDLVIHRIAVKSEYHHQKVGDALMKYAEQFAKENHIPSIKIDTHRKNIPMQKLCSDNDYHLSGVIYIKRVEPDPSRLMFEKSIQN